MTRALLVLGLVGCTGPDPDPDTSTTPAGSPAPKVRCTPDGDNALRIECTSELEHDLPILKLSADGKPTRTFQPTEPGRWVAWGLKPDTAYTWEIEDHSGAVSTGPLPANLAQMTIEVSGAPEGFDAVALPVNCDTHHVVMVDGVGDVVWYEPFSVYNNGMDGLEWSQDDLSFLASNDSVFQEISVTGELLLDLTGQFDGRAHHDVARWGPYTYILHDYEVDAKTVDAVHVFEGETPRGTFRFEDNYDIPPGVSGPGRDEWGHANGVNATVDGHIVTSLLIWDSVVTWDGDPESPTFGQIQWVAAGGSNGLPGADFVGLETTGEGFDGQHNASYVGDDLWLFDNTGVYGRSRAARYALIEATGEVLLAEDWDIGDYCQIQGGAVPVVGGALASCATSRAVAEFALGSEEPVFELWAGCGSTGIGPGGESMNRGLPIRFP